MKDSEFLSGEFFYFEIPKSKRYLEKYFKTDLQKAFLKYYFVFGSSVNFTDHTGHYCSRRLQFRMINDLNRLVKAYETAKHSLTEEGMETVDLIERGKLRLTKLPKS